MTDEYTKAAAQRFKEWNERKKTEIEKRSERQRLENERKNLFRVEGRKLWDAMENCLRKRAKAINDEIEYEGVVVENGSLSGNPSTIKISTKTNQPIESHPSLADEGKTAVIKLVEEFKAITVQPFTGGPQKRGMARYSFAERNGNLVLLDTEGQTVDAIFLCEKILEEILP